MNVCMVGTGYVGLVTGACLADLGMNVICVDKDEAKIAALGRGVIPIYEPGLEELVGRNERKGRLRFTTDLKAGIESALVIFIAVGTPPKPDGSPDLTFVRQVAEAVAENLNDYKVLGTTFELIEATIRVNARTKARMLDKIKGAAGPLAGKTAAVLGLSFKPETDDIRESPALAVVADLLAAGVRVRAFDPAAMENTKAVFPELHYAKDAYDCAAGADFVVLATEWNEFRALDLERLAAAARSRTMLDLRNVYDPAELRAAGWNYTGVGR